MMPAETFYMHMIKCPQMKQPQYNILKMGGQLECSQFVVTFWYYGNIPNIIAL